MLLSDSSRVVKLVHDVSTVYEERRSSTNVGELEAVIGIEEWAGFTIHLLTDTEKRWIETFSFGPILGGQR